MAWNSSLKRKTPLKSNGGIKPSERKEKSAKPKKRQRTSLMTHLDIVFSQYIRLRDAMEGGMTRCISCGRVLPFAQMQCGHFFGRVNLSTRWDEDNCHSECALDNCSNPNHLDGYKRNLIVKIGEERYDALCSRARETRKWSGEELRELIKHYTMEIKKLSKEKGIRI